MSRFVTGAPLLDPAVESRYLQITGGAFWVIGVATLGAAMHYRGMPGMAPAAREAALAACFVMLFAEVPFMAGRILNVIAHGLNQRETRMYRAIAVVAYGIAIPMIALGLMRAAPASTGYSNFITAFGGASLLLYGTIVLFGQRLMSYVGSRIAGQADGPGVTEANENDGGPKAMAAHA